MKNICEMMTRSYLYAWLWICFASLGIKNLIIIQGKCWCDKIWRWKIKKGKQTPGEGLLYRYRGCMVSVGTFEGLCFIQILCQRLNRQFFLFPWWMVKLPNIDVQSVNNLKDSLLEKAHLFVAIKFLYISWPYRVSLSQITLQSCMILLDPFGA